MIYFVDAKTKNRIEYGDVPNPNETPVSLNKIGREIVAAKWDNLYAVCDDGRRSATYKIDDAINIAYYLVTALIEITSLHYTVTLRQHFPTSKKQLGVIEPYRGRYGLGYKWLIHYSSEFNCGLVSYVVF